MDFSLDSHPAKHSGWNGLLIGRERDEWDSDEEVVVEGGI